MKEKGGEDVKRGEGISWKGREKTSSLTRGGMEIVGSKLMIAHVLSLATLWLVHHFGVRFSEEMDGGGIQEVVSPLRRVELHNCSHTMLQRCASHSSS